MAFIQKDRVRESSATVGIVDIILGGAQAGYQSFSSVMSVGDTCVYSIVLPGSSWEDGIGTYSAANTLTRTTVKESSNGGSLVVFPAGTKDVFIGPIASQTLAPGGSQNFSAAEKSQLRANIDLMKFNYIIDGAMMVSQENGSTAGTTSGYYPVDMLQVLASNDCSFSTSQVASQTPAGSPNRLRVTVIAADASIAAGQYLMIRTAIEGYRLADLKFGSASAKQVILPFGVKAPAGTYGVGFNNSGFTRSYVGEFTIAAGEANVDVVKSITLTGDAAGSWLTNNGGGLYLTFSLSMGSTYQTTGGSWQAGSFQATSNQFNFMGTNGNVFELFDVGLYEGTGAPAFKVPDYQTELSVCQRYWQKSYDYALAPASNNSNGALANSTVATALYTFVGMARFPTRMRVAPSVTLYSPVTGSTSSPIRFANAGTDNSGAAQIIGETGFEVQVMNASVATNELIMTHYTANARL